jgi:hypothetical protein
LSGEKLKAVTRRDRFPMASTGGEQRKAELVKLSSNKKESGESGSSEEGKTPLSMSWEGAKETEGWAVGETVGVKSGGITSQLRVKPSLPLPLPSPVPGLLRSMEPV